MKIAVISNINSNIYALEAFLHDIKKQNIEIVLNLGDSFLGSINPRQTYELLRQSSFINICGNEDRKILEASLTQLEEDDLLANVYKKLGEDVLYWIQDLPFEKLIGKDFYMVHGTYFNDQDCLLENKDGMNNEKKIVELIDNEKAKFIFCSNSQKPKCVNLKSTGQIVTAPGYLGAINDSDTMQKASYIVLNITDDEFEIKPHEINYEIK